jgi:hypothetical protein
VGLFLSPILTVDLEFACEVAYPVGEAYSNGMIQIFGNLTGTLAIFFMPKMLNKTKAGSNYLMLSVILISFISLLLILPMKETLNRSKAE